MLETLGYFWGAGHHVGSSNVGQFPQVDILAAALALTSVATQHSGCIEQDLIQIVEVDIS